MRFTARVPLGILAVMLAAVIIQAAPVQEAMTKQVLSATPDRTVMTMSFDQAAVMDAISFLEFDQQHLDGYGAMLAINGSEAPSVRILHYELGEAAPIGSLDANEIPATASDMIHVSEPAVIHGLQVVSVGVFPLLRDGNGVARAVRNLEFEIEFTGGASTLDAPDYWSQAFEPLFRTMVDNLDELYPNRSLAKPGRYLVLGPTGLLSQLQELSFHYRDWLDLKRRKGYHVQVKTLADVAATVGDSTESSIREFIRQSYETSWLPDLEYAVIIGDVTGTAVIPSRYMQNPEYPDNPENVSIGDNFFFAVDGSDYIADVFHGRISAETLTNYVSYFAKVLGYEQNPYRENLHWFESASCIAGNFADGSQTYPVTPVWNMNWAREIILRDGCITDADTFYYHDLTEPQGEWTIPIKNDIQAGVCAVFYRGYASQQLWQYPWFGNTQIMEMNVETRHPAVFGIVCGSGDFEASPCMGELWTTGVGTVPSPNGAIIFFGASDLHTNTRHNNAMLAGIIRALQDGVRSGGALAMAGKLEVFKQFPLELDVEGLVHFYGFHVFNLLGDPETQIYFCTPGALALSHDPLSPGQNLVTLTVRDEATAPVANAAVTLRNGDSQDIACGMTNEQGEVTLPADLAAGGEAQMYAWKAGYFSDDVSQSIAATAFDPYIATVEWDAGPDDLPNPGETANFNLFIENRGTAAFTPSCSITSDDERISVTSGTAAGSAVEPGATVSVGPFTIELNGYPLPDGLRPLLDVAITDEFTANRLIEIPVSAPDPQIWAVTVNDADGILSPGETATISVSVVNRGSVEGSVNGRVGSFDNGITITNGDLSWGNLPRGEVVQSTIDFTAAIPEDATPGRQIVLRFTFEMNEVEFTSKLKLLVAGVVTDTIPTGPDSYGYYAYEDIDIGYSSTPTYNWIELNSDSVGGSYDDRYEMHDDTHTGIELPTPFTFYGQSYDSIWICSNGWLSFGYAMMPEFRNWEIPSPIGPPAMVCPFWDDLISYASTAVSNLDTLHYIYTKHDGNRFIVQWQTLNRRGLDTAPSTDYCTFEAILEYGTGDGSILCQYKQISNIDTKQNYASIGIQNADHLDGLGLTYANMYIASVDTIRAGRAIRFTTTPPDEYLGQDDPNPSGLTPLEFALHSAFPNPFNPTTELRFDLTATALTTLRIYDVLGREAATLLNKNMTAGSHAVQFNAAGLPSGLYFARLISGSDVAVQKLMLVK
ncbi:T9SS type A sorting domain-containing protein [bacterium]|nr:T9SS type A sorting domain-containing protein [bacterium]